MPGRHSACGLRFTVVSTIDIGAQSVAVLARPALPQTEATSGKLMRMLSCTCSSRRCWVSDTLGRVLGMYIRLPSRSGGMNSLPSRLKGSRLTTSKAAAIPSTVSLPRSAQRSTGRYNRGGPSIQRIRLLRPNAPLYQEAHQNRHERDREQRRRRHGEGLGERQRPEQAALLILEREDRQERERDDQEGHEKRRPDLLRGGEDPFPVRSVRLALDVLVQILDHDDGRVDHRSDGDGDAAERHDVGVDPHPADHGERTRGCPAASVAMATSALRACSRKQHAHQPHDERLLEQCS